jgi:hypothetical protein
MFPGSLSRTGGFQDKTPLCQDADFFLGQDGVCHLWRWEMKNQVYSCNWQEGKSVWDEIPDVYYSAEEADKHLKMIRPILKQAQRLVEENPGKFPIFEWCLGYYMLYVQGEEENITT